MRFSVDDIVEIVKCDDPDYIGCIGVIKEVKDTGKHQYLIFCKGLSKSRWFKDDEVSEFLKIKGGNNMNNRGLYEVIVVDPADDGEVILEEKVIAKNESDAKFLAKIKEVLKERKLRLGDVDIIVNKLGDIRPYEVVQPIKLIGKMNKFILAKEKN